MKANNLIPRRTIRVVAWTAEENDGAGAQGYFDQHREDLDKTVFSLESDDGTLTPTYWSFDGSEEAMKIVQDISNLMKPTLNMEVERVEISDLLLYVIGLQKRTSCSFEQLIFGILF